MGTARTILQLVGFGCFISAAWFAFGIIGLLVVSGASLFVIEVLLRGE